MTVSRKRTFTIDHAAHADSCDTKFKIHGSTGRFKHKDPRGAAKKAFSSLCRRKRIKGRCVLYISVREITQASPTKGKVFTYRFTRRKSAVPGPFGQTYEVIGKSVGSVPSKCPKTRKSKGRMFSRTAKGKTGKYAYKSKSKSKSRSRSKSKSKSKSQSKPKSKSKSQSKPKSKSKSVGKKQKKSTLSRLFGL